MQYMYNVHGVQMILMRLFLFWIPLGLQFLIECCFNMNLKEESFFFDGADTFEIYYFSL